MTPANECDRCGRTTPQRRLMSTRVGLLCQRCADHLPKRHRRPPAEATRVASADAEG